jgi:hypothetical protein
MWFTGGDFEEVEQAMPAYTKEAGLAVSDSTAIGGWIGEAWTLVETLPTSTRRTSLAVVACAALGFACDTVF